ncbi:MAG: haloacid dehalogenase [Rhodospirillales bacterium]|nr:haloacid dehalogenase [Rhodospirillales bacterium]
MRFALLFDLDGTLADTEALHLKAFETVFGRPIDLDYFNAHISGQSNERIMAHAFPGRSVDEHVVLSDRKESLYRSFVGPLDPTPGLPELLRWASRHALPCAVVTNAPRANATLVLAALGLSDRFDCVIAGDEVGRSKPHPEPYLTALDALGSQASNAVAFEDSLSGLRAAVAAGLPTFGMLTSLREADLLREGAVQAIDDFRDGRLWDWLERRVPPIKPARFDR